MGDDPVNDHLLSTKIFWANVGCLRVQEHIQLQNRYCDRWDFIFMGTVITVDYQEII